MCIVSFHITKVGNVDSILYCQKNFMGILDHNSILKYDMKGSYLR